MSHFDANRTTLRPRRCCATEVIVSETDLPPSGLPEMRVDVERAAQHDLFMQAPIAIAILEGPSHTFTDRKSTRLNSSHG